jgi:hypothetical protein
MNRTAAVTLLTSLSMLVCACGQGSPLGDGKRGAAKAAYTALRPANEADTGTSWNPLTAASQPIDVSLTTEVKGKAQGKATVSLEVSTSSIDNPSNVGVRRNIAFADFSDDGKTRYNGSLKAELLVTTDGSSASVKYAVKGRITLSGEVDDVLDIDTTLDVAAAAYDASAVDASVKLNGTIVTRSGRYDYANEAFSIDVLGDLPADTSVNP